MTILKLKKGSKIEKIPVTLIFIFDQKLFKFFFYKSFLYTNDILMFIIKRSISTRGFKNSASELQSKLFAQTSETKNGLNTLRIE